MSHEIKESAMNSKRPGQFTKVNLVLLNAPRFAAGAGH